MYHHDLHMPMPLIGLQCLVLRKKVESNIRQQCVNLNFSFRQMHFISILPMEEVIRAEMAST